MTGIRTNGGWSSTGPNQATWTSDAFGAAAQGTRLKAKRRPPESELSWIDRLFCLFSDPPPGKTTAKPSTRLPPMQAPHAERPPRAPAAPPVGNPSGRHKLPPLFSRAYSRGDDTAGRRAGRLPERERQPYHGAFERDPSATAEERSRSATPPPQPQPERKPQPYGHSYVPPSTNAGERRTPPQPQPRQDTDSDTASTASSEMRDVGSPTFSQKVVNAYATLGLRRGASKGEIEKAYKKLAAKYHPDRNFGANDVRRAEMSRKFVAAGIAKDFLLTIVKD